MKNVNVFRVAFIAVALSVTGCADESNSYKVQLVSPSGTIVNVDPTKMSECPRPESGNCYRPETHTVQLVMSGGQVEHLPIPSEDVARMGL